MEKVIKGLECCSKGDCADCDNCTYHGVQTDVPCESTLMKDALALLKAQEAITGETSDGYHTFNELYHHRAVLFSVIVANYKDRAWKSVRHHDGTMYDGMFIVGIDTPDGQATYHYDINPYWDMFDCKVREFAPEWDGHTPAQAIERIGKLKAQEPRVMTDTELEAIRKAPLILKPAVDAVPVVRCKDCKYGKLCFDADGHRLIQCTNTNYPAANVETWPLELDWYCAGGERRESE